MLDISATDIRQRLGDGRPISDSVPPSVERYIREHGLYLEAGDCSQASDRTDDVLRSLEPHD